MLLDNIYFKAKKKLGLLKLKPVVFLHLQKTAGTTIVSVAKRFYGNNKVISHSGFYLDANGKELAGDGKPQQEFRQNMLGSIPFISGHFGYEFAKPLMAGRYSFTILRNPVERVLSFYYFCQSRDPKQFEIYALAQRSSLDEFLGLGFTDPTIKAHLYNYQVYQLAAGWGGSNLMLAEEEALKLALEHLDEFTYVGFTETFDTDRDNILKDIGIVIPVDYFKTNVSPDRPRFAHLPQPTKDLLLGLTKLDQILYDTAWSKRNVLG